MPRIRATLPALLLPLTVAACAGAPAASPPRSTAALSPGATEVTSIAPSAGVTTAASPVVTVSATPRPTAPPPPGAIGTPFPTTQPAAAVSLVPNGATTHVHFDRIAFDIPSSWAYRPANVNEHYIDLVGFVGTAPSTAGCWPMSPAPPAIGATTCTYEFNLAPGDVSILLETQDGPPNVAPLGPLTLGDGDRVVDVDGIPAVTSDSSPRAPAGSSLRLQDPSNLYRTISLQAGIQGADTEALRQQVADVFASVHYDPAVALPDTTPANEQRVIARALEQIRASQPGYECFPAKVGGSAAATLGGLPGMEPASSPVDVTCHTDLVPDGAFWKLTLAVEWGRHGDASTTSTAQAYLLADGTPSTYPGFDRPLP